MKNDDKNKERAKLLVAAPADRVLLTLRWADRLTDAEIAAATDRPEREVAARLAQLETRLKRAA